MNQRTYTGADDLKLLQDFNAAAIAETDHCGYLHPGDIPHHIYNGNKHYNPVELITIWEDERGISAWLLADPGHRSFDAQVRPDLRGSEFERDVLRFAAAHTADLMHRYGVASDRILADAFQGDTHRARLLVELGWKPEDEQPYVLNRMEIQPVPAPFLPDGYIFRSAAGVEEAAALARIHNAAFGSIWTSELYRYVMESPGYDPARELLIEAPDGNLVAFTIIWFDPLNRTGLFEPVGTHRDHQRRGFGKVILRYGIQKMAAAGMVYATVANFGDNEAARGLYQACGFRPWYLIQGYTRLI